MEEFGMAILSERCSVMMADSLLVHTYELPYYSSLFAIGIVPEFILFVLLYILSVFINVSQSLSWLWKVFNK